MPNDWEIKSRSRVCSISQVPFEDGQTIYSCLKRSQQGFDRLDIAEAHWTPELRDQSLSSWRSVYNAPPPPAPEALKKETAETLLRQFMSRDDESRAPLMFILAVMLERKRELVERDIQTRDDGTRIRIYEHKRTGEMFAIPDPELKLDELESVQAQVNDLLGVPPRNPPPSQS